MDINKLCPYCMTEVNKESNTVCPHCGCDFSKALEVHHQLKPYTILAGKYLVGGVLGEGGFGITYIGLDLNLEIRVAIKEFYPNGYVTRESQSTNTLTAYSGKNLDVVYKWRDNFLKEARSLAKCSHLSGVVKVREFFQENNTAYIVQEYLEGKTLKEYCKEKGGKLPVEQLLNSLEPVILALGEVHKEGLIHRDISPDNIMLLKGGQMKLLDFGAARDFTEEGEKSLSVLLKPGYAPEEQYRTKGNQGPWSDIYAMAGTIYKCITGITPPESMERMRKDELQKPSALGISIPPHIEKALLKAMEVYAEKRYQSIEEFHKALYTQKLPVTVAENNNTKPSSRVSRMPVNKNKRTVTSEQKLLMAAICCVIVIVIAMAMLFGKSKKHDVVEVEEIKIEQNEGKERGVSEETVTEEAATEEAATEEIEKAESVYCLAKETSYRKDSLERVIEYDIEGNVVSDISYNEDGSVSARSESEYDSEGNEISYVRYSGDGSISYRYEREYDNVGNEVCFVSYKEDGSVSARREYEYDSAGNCVSTILYNESSEIINSFKTEYDDAGKAIKSITYNADGSINAWIEYTYDSNGEEPSEVSYNADGSISVRREYKYDSVGNEISFAEYEGDGSISYKIETEYDNDGKKIREVSYDSIINENREYIYEYGALGNLKKDVCYINGEIAYIDEYNSNGDCIYSTNYYSYSNPEGQEFKYEYEYDEKGNCLLYKKYYYPQGNIYWLEEKKYDEQGRIVEERNYEYSETAFGDFRYYYKYDDNGNLIKKEWHYYDMDGTESGFQVTNYEYKTKEEFELSSEESDGIHRYELIAEDVTWEEAFEDCINRGGYLVHINSEDEFIAITNQIREEQKTNYTFWLGAMYEYTSDAFYWVDENGEYASEKVSNNDKYASYWLPGEPSIYGTYYNEDGEELLLHEDYISMIYRQSEDRFYWNDIQEVPDYLSGKIGYICEYD